MSTVFLSHTHHDKDFARRLTVDLRKNGHIVWIDEAEIEIGDSLVEKIRDGIDRVDYIAAVISERSINSEWVKKELDLATNREIAEKRVVVLPLLLDDVQLPGFLQGKLFADFRDEAIYGASLSLLLRKLGPSIPAPALNKEEYDELRNEVDQLRKVAEYHSRESDRQKRLVALSRNAKLNEAIAEDNARHPEWATINNAYAFEALGQPVTLGYVMFAIGKAERKGSSILESVLSVEDKWDNLHILLEAYADYRGFPPPSDIEDCEEYDEEEYDG